jgi:hypothetical protein
MIEAGTTEISAWLESEDWDYRSPALLCFYLRAVATTSR